eukprot:9990147-Lingulodinium_polyedra.AAC.1
MERADARRANRCDGETLIRPHHCATFHECLNRRFAAAMAQTSNSRALHARTSSRSAYGTRG